jgi:hypothetical protein
MPPRYPLSTILMVLVIPLSDKAFIAKSLMPAAAALSASTS